MTGRVMDLVSRAHLLWKRRVARDLVPYGINPKQIYLLRRLSAAGHLTPSAIADLLFADRPTITSMLGTMERTGWISRRRDPANRKQVHVRLTAAGQRKLASVPPRLWRTGSTAFDPEAGLSPAERDAVVRLLERLTEWIARGDPGTRSMPRRASRSRRIVRQSDPPRHPADAAHDQEES